jgi:aspartokinase/homoserine dehydrogenase 1
MKFGGTSVGSVQGLLSVKKIVEAQEESVIVVVSALSGITDQLYKVATFASNGDENYLNEYQSMLQRHIEVINAVVPENKINSVLELVKIQFNDLSNILRGLFLIKDTSPKIIVANTIEDAVHFESKNFIKTIHQFDKHVVDFPTTNALIKERFSKRIKFLFAVVLFHRIVPPIISPILDAEVQIIQQQYLQQH